MNQMVDDILFFYSYTRGGGKTYRAAMSLRSWALEHPDQRGAMVAHDERFADYLKHTYFADLKNVNVVNMNTERALRGSRIGAMEIDHHAMRQVIQDLVWEADRAWNMVRELENTASTKFDFDQWLDYGIRKGFCSPQVCATHAGIPMSEGEEMDEDGDFCVHVVRLGTPEEWQADIEVLNEDRMDG
jgi:hypothetical protein